MYVPRETVSLYNLITYYLVVAVVGPLLNYTLNYYLNLFNINNFISSQNRIQIAYIKPLK